MHKAQTSHVKWELCLATNVCWKWGTNSFRNCLAQTATSILITVRKIERRKKKRNITLVPFQQGEHNDQHPTTLLVPVVCYCSL